LSLLGRTGLRIRKCPKSRDEDVGADVVGCDTPMHDA
jgi:hypothetical protein